MMNLGRLHSIKIGDLGRIVTGKTPSTKQTDFWGGNIPFVTPADLQNGKRILKTERTVTENGANAVRGALLPPKSICVSCIGNLGYTAMTTCESVSNQQINSIIPSEDYDAEFVYYLMKSIWSVFKSLEGQSTTLSILNKTLFSQIEVTVPDIETQKRIARILSSLDDKIEVNNQINRNLEEQAKAIFKSWFVDFEPFKDGKFVDSELGPIPEGWRVGTIKDMLEIRYGKDHKKLSNGTIPVYGSGGLMRFVDKVLYSGESVLIPRKGTLNNVMLVNGDFWTLDTMFYSIPKRNGAAKYAFHILSNMDMASMNTGSAVPSMTVDVLNSIRIIVPPQKQLDSLGVITEKYWRMREMNNQENNALANSRDTLLPKLISGEIDLAEIQL